MNILFLIPSLAGGGQEKAGMFLSNYLSRFHKVTVVCLESKQPGEFEYQAEIIRLEIPRRKSIAGKIKVGAQRIKILKSIKRKLKTDISIAFGNTAIILNALADNGDKKIVSIRQSFSGMRHEVSFRNRLHHQLYKWAIKKADKIVPVSKGINAELKEIFSIKNENFIYNGFDFKSIKAKAAEQLSIPLENRVWIAHIGRFDVSKGHWHLVRIFAEVKKQIPSVGLMLIGGVDKSSSTNVEIFEFCKKYIQSNGMTWSGDDYAADVLFLGHQDNPFKFIARAEIFVMPSLWEGFPNALVEAMICGIPVVSADCETGPREILQDSSGNSYGILLPAFKDKFDEAKTKSGKLDYHWSEKICALIRDRQAMELFRQKSMERATEFSLERSEKCWLEIIEETK